MTNFKRTSVLIDPDDITAMKHLTKRLDLSVSQMVRRAVTEYVARNLTLGDLDKLDGRIEDPHRWTND